MSKITRRSYKRKKIIMGIALFGAIGLVSTGFAAWVLSASASNSQEANLKVGAVSDKSMSFQNMKIYGMDTNPDSDTKGTEIELEASYANFSFNPAYDDNAGRVRFGKGEITEEHPTADIGERLTLRIAGEVNEAQNMGTLQVKFDEIPDELTSAVTKNYITLPACANALQDVTYTLSGEGTQIASFSYSITFGWGSAFGGVNPSVYYDNAGINVPIATVKDTLDELHDLLDNVHITATFVAMPN